jgi:isoquinoline 1-oxidoreductase beta subunit
VKRRAFLVAGAVAGVTGTGLLVGLGSIVSDRLGTPGSLAPRAGTVGLNGWVRIDADGSLTVTLAHIEMGQGIATALPMLVAEELDVPMARVRTEPADVARRYGNRAVYAATWWFTPDSAGTWWARALVESARAAGAVLGVQITGGSSSVSDTYETLRMAGACARAMLVNAAAGRWNVAAQQCTTAEGAVFYRGQRIGYGELAAEAARLGVPERVEPKPAGLRRLVGTTAPRLDIPDKVCGAAIYGADVRLPGMLFAAVRGCPVPGGTLAHYDPTSALALPGVVQVLTYDGGAGCAPGIGAIARDTWKAQLAVSACRVEWDRGAVPSFDTAQLLERLHAALEGDARGTVYGARGAGAAGLERAARVVQADYAAPWLAHATMEAMNCTAQWTAGEGAAVDNGAGASGARLKLWVPTQVPSLTLDTAARVSGLERSRIDLQVTAVGGGFGRRLETDYLVPAIALARAVQPAPVQVQWSREEDMTHDFYRPAALCRLQAGLDAQGRPIAWVTRSVSDSVSARFLERSFPRMAAAAAMLPDRTEAEGLWDQAYEFVDRHCAHVTVPLPVPIGNWRSVGHSHMAFFAESFIDELAKAAGADPLAYRRALLEHHPRHRAVLDLAAQRAGWEEPLPPGRARGLALHESFGTIVAQVAEVSLAPGGAHPPVRVHRVVCALDCGTVLNPGIVAQQVEGSVIFALSACWYGEITFRDSQVEQKNFPDYEMLRLRDAPSIETWIVPSSAPPTGVGEPATPPLAPAVANALFALTGQRLRSLPLRPERSNRQGDRPT